MLIRLVSYTLLLVSVLWIHEPTAEEISEAMNGELSAKRIREIQRIAMEPVSLETPIGEEDDSHLGDFIEDKESESPVDFTSDTEFTAHFFKSSWSIII